MKPAERDPQHLLEAVHYLDKAQGFLARFDQDQFLQDEIVQLATAKVLEVALDACWKLTKEFKADHAEIDWYALGGLRHELVHDYGQVSVERLRLIAERCVTDWLPLLQELANPE